MRSKIKSCTLCRLVSIIDVQDSRNSRSHVLLKRAVLKIFIIFPVKFPQWSSFIISELLFLQSTSRRLLLRIQEKILLRIQEKIFMHCLEYIRITSGISLSKSSSFSLQNFSLGMNCDCKSSANSNPLSSFLKSKLYHGFKLCMFLQPAHQRGYLIFQLEPIFNIFYTHSSKFYFLRRL